jgi:heptosyltransferase-1
MRALVINLSNMGDVISGHVVHLALQKKGYEIDLLTLPQFTGLLHENDGIRPLAFGANTLRDLQAESYDLIVDLISTGETRRLVKTLSAPVKVGRYNGWAKWLKMRFVYNVLVPKYANDHVVKDYWVLFAKLGLETVEKPEFRALPIGARAELTDSWWPRGDVVGLHFGASVPKRVLPAEKMNYVINQLALRGKTVFLIGHEEDLARDLVRQHGSKVFYRKLNLRELRAVFERLEFFVGPDSGPLHLAAALNKPALGVYGPNLPSRSGPLASSVRFLESPLHCRPCNQNIPCPINLQCIRQIPDADFISALQPYLN